MDSVSRIPVVPFASRLRERQVKNPALRSYLGLLGMHRHEAHGAIVMNANPFTLGHLYLIETARSLCDYLYIFVVEEDKSEISFIDRLAMVKANCMGMDNVEVLPSGKYMVSTMTFAEYFEKAESQETMIVPSQDVRLFGDAIAPTLGITKRFVGEEPFNKVTRQYNEAMKHMLPNYGIELVEIPRKKTSDGVAINATQVRKWIKEGKWENCKMYLPKPTLDYLHGQGRI